MMSTEMFMLESQLVKGLKKPLPQSPEAATSAKIRRAKYIAYLRELASVENLLDTLDLEDDCIRFLSEDAFFKKISFLHSKNEHSFLYDGTYIKVVGFYEPGFFIPSRAIIWFKKIKQV